MREQLDARQKAADAFVRAARTLEKAVLAKRPAADAAIIQHQLAGDDMENELCEYLAAGAKLVTPWPAYFDEALVIFNAIQVARVNIPPQLTAEANEAINAVLCCFTDQVQAGEASLSVQIGDADAPLN